MELSNIPNAAHHSSEHQERENHDRCGDQGTQQQAQRRNTIRKIPLQDGLAGGIGRVGDDRQTATGHGTGHDGM